MPTKLSERPNDGSTASVTITFRDTNGTLVTPDSIQWSLRNEDGTIINGRNLETAVPSTSITVVLSGDDLLYADGVQRILTIYAVYDSDLGSDLPLNDEATFYIEDLKGV